MKSHLQSYPCPLQINSFISLVKNCNHKGLGIYYLLSAFIFGISGTLISVLIRIELYSSGNRIISPENQNFYNINITLHGFLMIFFLVMLGSLYELIFSFLFWFRDLLRELDKNYEILLIIFFLDFLLFLVSEGLLFVYFFWTSFHSLPFSTLETWSGEGFCLPDPCELTFNNTLLLSNAAISFGN